MNHPFLDGNKRIAFFATDIFLRLNGWKFSVNANQAHYFLIKELENRQNGFDKLKSWIQNSISRL